MGCGPDGALQEQDIAVLGASGAADAERSVLADDGPFGVFE